MLTPQHRATCLSTEGVIDDQTQSSLPVAGGSAIAMIDPEPAKLIRLERPVFELVADRFRNLVDQLDLDPAILAGLLAQLSTSGPDLAAFNKALSTDGIGMAIDKSKG